MAKNPFGTGFRSTRQRTAFGQPARRANPFGAAAPRRVDVIEKPKNFGQAANNQASAQEALAGGVCLAFTYDGLPRVVEVHTVGATRAGRPAMNVWQTEGQSEEGPVPDWRTFCFDECFDLRVTDIASEAPRPGYRRDAKQFARIIVEL